MPKLGQMPVSHGLARHNQNHRLPIAICIHSDYQHPYPRNTFLRRALQPTRCVLIEHDYLPNLYRNELFFSSSVIIKLHNGQNSRGQVNLMESLSPKPLYHTFTLQSIRVSYECCGLRRSEPRMAVKRSKGNFACDTFCLDTVLGYWQDCCLPFSTRNSRYGESS